MRVGWTAVLMALGAASGSEGAYSRPDLPARSTQGFAQAVVLCLVADRTTDRLRLQERLSHQLLATAQKSAPVPVSVIGVGDPVITRADVLGILVHVSIDRGGERPLAILSVRAHRAAADRSPLFGAAPVAVPLTEDGLIPEPALAAVLDEVLPWRMHSPPKSPASSRITQERITT